MATPLNAHEWEAAAAASLPEDSAAYLFGGAEDERSLRANREAFERIGLRPRVLAGFAEPHLATTVLGTPSAMPILVAPVGHQRLFHADGELATARAAAAAGTVFALSTMANATIEEVAEVGGPRWFQLYAIHDRAHRRELVARAEAAGYAAILLTVDVASLGRRERDLRAGFAIPEWVEMPLLVRSRDGDLTLHQTSAMIERALSFADLEEVCGWTSLPVAVKGVLRPDDAVRCAEHGAAGVVVSNHGGRQLDGAVAPIDVLTEIADEAGDALEVLLDSGVRRGVDVLAALALGARAVLVGRPVVSGLAVDGEEGAAAVLGQLRAELALAMHLAGCPDVAAVPRDLVA